MLLWRMEYRWRVLGDEQFDSTCLLVWTALHKVQRLEADLPHRFIFASVASCCCRAFLTNLKLLSRRVKVYFDHLLISWLLKQVLIEETKVPWISRLFTWAREREVESLVRLRRASRNDVFKSKASMGTFLWEVSAHSRRMLASLLSRRPARTDRLCLSAMIFKEGIPNPPWHNGSWTISSTQVLMGYCSQDLILLVIRESSSFCIHVFDRLYKRSSKFSWLGMYSLFQF